MSPFIPRALPLIGMAALALTAPAAARAAPAVYGGSTRADDAIVVDANRSATKLRSVVIAWTATCRSSMSLSNSDVLRAGAPGGGPAVLGMTRNRNGRFAGKQISVGAFDDGSSVLATVSLRG